MLLSLVCPAIKRYPPLTSMAPLSCPALPPPLQISRARLQEFCPEEPPSGTDVVFCNFASRQGYVTPTCLTAAAMLLNS